jgi:hypothetical protein
MAADEAGAAGNKDRFAFQRWHISWHQFLVF